MQKYINDNIPMEDTIICDFEILDPAGDKVFPVLFDKYLVAGVEYTVRGHLCWYRTLLGIKYGGCAEILKGCDDDYEVPERTVDFVVSGGRSISGTTDADGYVEIPWTPSEAEVGTISVRLEFDGDVAYNPAATDWESLTVVLPAEVIISSYTIPDDPVVGEDAKFPCTVENQGGSDTEVRVFLIDRDTGEEVCYKPDLPLPHWRDIKAGESYSFDGLLDTLHGEVPSSTWNLRIEVRQEVTPDKVDHLVEFSLSAATGKPSWFSALLTSLGIRNIEEITSPILKLFEIPDIEGWTDPPFTCPICEVVFDNSETVYDDFANHLMSHIKAFEEQWFKSPPTCTQDFKVVDHDTGLGIADSVVIVRGKEDKLERGRCTSGADGSCSVTDLTEGEWVIAEASAPPGYEVIFESSIEFSTCTSLRTLKLKEI